MTGEIGHHHEGALQDADHQDVLALIVGGDLPAHLCELGIDLLAGDQGSNLAQSDSSSATAQR